MSVRENFSNDFGKMNSKETKEIELNGLKPKQIEQLKAIIEDFKQQNQRKDTYPQDEGKSEVNSLNDIFFESDILQPFNRNTLYGKRS
jgi:hypothetical protein